MGRVPIMEEYNVLRANRKIKQGYYKLYVDTDQVVSGKYNNNKKAGIWTYYKQDNSISLRYNFDTDSVIYFNDEYDSSEYDRPLLYLGSMSKAKCIVAYNLVYPEVAQENGWYGKILVDIYVDETGKAYDFKSQNRKHKTLDNEAIRVVKLIPNQWLPAIKNGIPVKSKYTFPVFFILLN